MDAKGSVSFGLYVPFKTNGVGVDGSLQGQSCFDFSRDLV